MAQQMRPQRVLCLAPRPQRLVHDQRAGLATPISHRTTPQSQSRSPAGRRMPVPHPQPGQDLGTTSCGAHENHAINIYMLAAAAAYMGLPERCWAVARCEVRVHARMVWL